jgi:hypothetical protein
MHLWLSDLLGLWGAGFYPDGLVLENDNINEHPNEVQAKAYAGRRRKRLLCD